MGQPLLITIAVGLMMAGTATMLREHYKPTRAIAAIGVGAFLLFVTLLWNWFPAGALRDGIVAAGNDFRWWFSIIAAQWLYVGAMNMLGEVRRNNEIVALRNDVQAIATVLERVVLPRHLTKRQQNSIAGFLKQFEGYSVAFKIAANDEEAGGYRVDIQQALERGGWKITTTTYAENLQDGVRSQFTLTTASMQQPEERANPKPDRLLQMAFGLAGVRFEGGGRGSGVAVTADLLTIEIGHRRKDSYAIELPLGL
jgi:hypothetical protein